MPVKNDIMSKISNVSSYYPTSEYISTTISGIDSSVFTTIRNPWEEKIKEYCEATDKHLDHLEEDIDFLDKMRKDTNEEIIFLCNQIGDFEHEISLLKVENANLRANLNDLYNQIFALQQKLDNQ